VQQRRTDRVPVRIYLEPESHQRWTDVASDFGLKPSTLLSMLVARAETDPRILQLAIVEPLMKACTASNGAIWRSPPKSDNLAQSGADWRSPPTHIHTSTHPQVHTKTSTQGADAQRGAQSDDSEKVDESPKPKPKRAASAPQAAVAAFGEWWKGVPRKVGKGAARRAWPGALRKVGWDGAARSPSLSKATAVLVAAAAKWKASTVDKDAQFICHPSTWLNGERWLDEDEVAEQTTRIDTARQAQARQRAEREHEHTEALLRECGDAARRRHLLARLNVYRGQLGWEPREVAQ